MNRAMLLALASILSLPAVALAAAPKTYQVTGPVVEVRDDVIVVQKGREKWEIAKGDVKLGDVKMGDKVMIEYRMTAASLEVKSVGKARAAAAANDNASASATAGAEKSAVRADKAADKADKAADKAEKAAGKADRAADKAAAK